MGEDKESRTVHHSEQDCTGRRSAVLYDSVCLHPYSKSLSPFTVVSDQSHYMTIFVQIQCKTMYVFGPMAHPALDDIISAFTPYHDTHDANGLLPVPGDEKQVAV